MGASAATLQLGSLPIPHTRLIGREAERAAAGRLLLDEAVPLLTLTGPGGVGKTRLALAVAQDLSAHFAEGVVFVDVTPITDADLVLVAIAHALDIRDVGEGDLLDRLTRVVQPRQYLLLVAYFVDRVHAAQSTFVLTEHNAPHIIEICRHLDGLPLAIELAAARSRLLGLAGIQERLGERLHLLSAGLRDGPARHRTLRETIVWSHALLAVPEQELFRRMAVFPGGATLEAVAAVAGDNDDARDSLDCLATLIDHIGKPPQLFRDDWSKDAPDHGEDAYDIHYLMLSLPTIDMSDARANPRLSCSHGSSESGLFGPNLSLYINLFFQVERGATFLLLPRSAEQAG